MSVRAVRWVLEQSPARGANRLVHLVLAERSNDANDCAWPSLSTIAEEAGVGRSTAVRCVKALRTAGLLERTGTSVAGTPVYRLLMGSGGVERTPVVSREHQPVEQVVSREQRGGVERTPEPEVTVREKGIGEVAKLNGQTVAVVERFKLAAKERPALTVKVPALLRALEDFSHLPDLLGEAIECAEYLRGPKGGRYKDAAAFARNWFRRAVQREPVQEARTDADSFLADFEAANRG